MFSKNLVHTCPVLQESLVVASIAMQGQASFSNFNSNVGTPATPQNSVSERIGECTCTSSNGSDCSAILVLLFAVAMSYIRFQGLCYVSAHWN